MAARLVPERVQLVTDKREPFALTYSRSTPLDEAPAPDEQREGPPRTSTESLDAP